MFIALNEAGKRVHASKAIKGERYYCPICKTEVILRAGDINIEHFSHKSRTNCDDFKHDISKWYLQMQSLFPIKNCEHVIEHNGEKHIADVCCYSTVIEFLHTSISEKEFDRRNEFFTSAGYKVVWILDMRSVYHERRLECYAKQEEDYFNGGKYRWSYPYKFLQEFDPKNRKDIIVILNLLNFDDSKNYFERVIWVCPGELSWKRFCTSFYPGNRNDLLSWLEKQWLRKKKSNN